MYYDGTKILSMLDINKRKPEMLLVDGNRTAGKTTFFSRYLVHRYFRHAEKFLLIYRFKTDLNNVSEQFYPDIQSLFFPNSIMTEKPMADGLFKHLYINDKSCGYAVPLNLASKLKYYGHLLSECTRGFLDEFQPEDGHYVDDEITKFLSLHTTIARGQGKQYKYFPIIMCSNAISLINPYYSLLGISDRLQSNTKFLRGDGFVLERSFNESASNAQKESGINSAFKNHKYTDYGRENIYLHDDSVLIEKVSLSKARYFATLNYYGEMFGMYLLYGMDGLLYVSKSYDLSHPLKISCTMETIGNDFLMLDSFSSALYSIRQYYQSGKVRFQNLKCKQAFFAILQRTTF